MLASPLLRRIVVCVAAELPATRRPQPLPGGTGTPPLLVMPLGRRAWIERAEAGDARGRARSATALGPGASSALFAGGSFAGVSAADSAAAAAAGVAVGFAAGGPAWVTLLA